MSTTIGVDASAREWRREVLEVRGRRKRDASFYSRIAPVYELWGAFAEGRARRRVLELARVRDGEAMLEVAVGSGKQLAALARLNPRGHTVGIDLAEGMLAVARKRLVRDGLTGVELRRGDALDLPFVEGSFDLLVNGYTLDLLPRDDIAVAVAEFHRVLRPGGRLVLSNMTKGNPPWHRFWDALYARGLPLAATCRGVLAAPVLAELGFTEIRREYVAQMLFPTEVVTARKPAGEQDEGS